jgi:heptosyltransferase-1
LSHEKILVTSQKLMGDLIVQTAALAALRRAFPTAHIVMLCEERITVALSTNPDVNEVWGIPFAAAKAARGLSGVWRKTVLLFASAWRIRRAHFTRVLVTDYSDKACLWAFFSGAKIRGGLAHQSMSSLLNRRLSEREGSGDYIDFYLKLAHLVGGTGNSRRTVFPLPHETPLAQKLIPGINPFYFAIHPGASVPEKRWPAENWARLITEILKQKKAAQFVLVCGPGETPLCEAIIASADKALRRRITLFAERPLVETARVLSQARLVFCLDSASRHLAAAIGVPSISLMAQWILPTWGLYSETDAHFILAADVPRDSYEISSISVREVMALFTRAMKRVRGKSP